MNKPLISVLFPVYNSEEFLAESLNSILKQTFRNFELIIVNDNSSDNSLNIIENKINTTSDIQIHLINNNCNLGLSKTLNKAFNVAKGKFVARMDSDDICMANRFEKLSLSDL